MNLRNLSPRRAAASSLGVAAALAVTVIAAPQAHAASATYWQFRSNYTGTCLTGGTSGVAYATTCTGSSYQQWDFVTANSEFNVLKNRGTGQCLTTDDKTNKNAVWTSTDCANTWGKRFKYNFVTQQFSTDLGTELEAQADGAVYSGPFNTAWVGWHN